MSCGPGRGEDPHQYQKVTGRRLPIWDQRVRQLGQRVEGVPLMNVFNYDKTNFRDDPGSSQCLFKKGVQYPEHAWFSTFAWTKFNFWCIKLWHLYNNNDIKLACRYTQSSTVFWILKKVIVPCRVTVIFCSYVCRFINHLEVLHLWAQKIIEPLA